MLGKWFRNLTSFIVDLCVDGFALVSFTAPVLSLGFTLAKAFDVPFAALHQLSYAWALLPLTIWFFVAYVRRRAAKDRAAKVAKLHEFYVRAAPFSSRTDLTEESLPQFVLDADAWANEAASWIEMNLGHAARARFIDRTDHAPIMFNGINPRHSNVLANVNGWRRNLSRIIETDAWDAKN